MQCEGKPYKTRKILSCPFHSKWYEHECEVRAAQAHDLIHETLGKVTSNLPESVFSICTHYRPKDRALEKTAYELTTNLGLLHANWSYMRKEKGEGFSWKRELFEAAKPRND